MTHATAFFDFVLLLVTAGALAIVLTIMLYVTSATPQHASSCLPSQFHHRPCLPKPAKEPPAGPGRVHEIKHDGFRILARSNGDICSQRLNFADRFLRQKSRGDLHVTKAGSKISQTSSFRCRFALPRATFPAHAHQRPSWPKVRPR